MQQTYGDKAGYAYASHEKFLSKTSLITVERHPEYISLLKHIQE
jgi:hypothetical protein